MKELLKRINYGYDGLIRSILIKPSYYAEVTISVMDYLNDNEWINIKFLIKDIVEFKVLQNKNTSNTVLSSGIKMKVIDNVHYIDFAPYSDEIDTINDFRQSEVYFAANNLEWKIEQYSEN